MPTRLAVLLHSPRSVVRHESSLRDLRASNPISSGVRAPARTFDSLVAHVRRNRFWLSSPSGLSVVCACTKHPRTPPCLGRFANDRAWFAAARVLRGSGRARIMIRHRNTHADHVPNDTHFQSIAEINWLAHRMTRAMLSACKASFHFATQCGARP
jgi:hypothetical protein